MNLENFSYFQLWNMLAVTTKAIKIILHNKSEKTASFWQVVRVREQIIREIDRANKVEIFET